MIVAPEINTLYTCAASASVRAISVDSELVNQFCLGHQAFQHAANANEGDLLLDEIVRLSLQLWYRVLSAPLPLCHPSLIDASTENLLLKRVSAVGQSYGHLREVSERYALALANLRSSDENPLWLAIEPGTVGKQADKVGLLIKPARLVAAVRDLAAAQERPMEVLMEWQLRHAVAFDRLYVFGAGRWYPGFVFSAPRAPVLQIVRYGVLSDSPPEEATFVKSLKPATRTLFAPTVGQKTAGSLQFGADEVRPGLDIASIVRRAGGDDGAGVSASSAGLVDVRALILEQDLAVLVLAAEGASELTVDLREEAEKLVHRVPVVDLEPGMAVLVRTEGGGDYIVAAADQILAEQAEELRRHQRYWKQLLHDLAEKLEIAEVLDRLKAAGSTIATYQNLHNWMSPRSIRTLRKIDFDAIFRVIGLAEDADQYWKMMAVIDRAHRYAGNLIRRRLLEQVKEADLSPLQTVGRQNFELPGEVGGGSLTAVRVIAVPTEVVRAHPSAVHRMFELVG